MQSIYDDDYDVFQNQDQENDTSSHQSEGTNILSLPREITTPMIASTIAQKLVDEVVRILTMAQLSLV